MPGLAKRGFKQIKHQSRVTVYGETIAQKDQMCLSGPTVSKKGMMTTNAGPRAASGFSGNSW